jgi:hypothetical protein
MSGVCSIRKKRNAYRILICKLENVRMYFKEIRWKGVNWLNLTEHRDKWRAVVKMAMNFLVP